MTGSSARDGRRRTTSKAAVPVRDRPPPGHLLLAGIDAVLPRLASPGASAPQLADDLRTALVRTAACGETCQVAAAADDVRHATTMLLAGSVDEACQALRHARATLVDRR